MASALRRCRNQFDVVAVSSNSDDAIGRLDTYKPHVDVLVLTRGGGSLESLQAFNSLEVAQAIFKSRIPVISAVGHENDITIADCGMVYVFICFDCFSTASMIQSY